MTQSSLPRARAQAIILAHPNIPRVTATSSPGCRTCPSLYQAMSAAGWDWMSHTSETLPLTMPSTFSGSVPTLQGASAAVHPKNSTKGEPSVWRSMPPQEETRTEALACSERVAPQPPHTGCDQHRGSEAVMQLQSHSKLQLVEEEEEGSQSVTREGAMPHPAQRGQSVSRLTRPGSQPCTCISRCHLPPPLPPAQGKHH